MAVLALAALLVLLTLVVFGACGRNDPIDEEVPDPPGGDVPEPGPTAWWNDQVFYEIFVRSFQDSDGDGIGDLQGVIDRLDYLNDGDPATTDDLGVTALWLMPICQSPSYHGYDVTDYRTIESDYGTNADFVALEQAAAARGIRIIVDFVMNHSSSEHPWFTHEAAQGPWSPETATWYRWRTTNPGTVGPWGQTVWHTYSSGRYYYGLFWSGMPDLNYGNPAVQDTMFDIADYWLQDMGVDGFRLDAVKYIFENQGSIEDVPATYAFWGDLRAHLDGVVPDAFLVGEAWDDTDTVLRYTEAGLDACFQFDLAGDIISATGTGSPGTMSSRVQAVADVFPYLQYATFLTNHDMNRLYTQLGRDAGRNGLAAAVLLTLPGVPFLYYGEEVGLVGSGPDEDKRRPMQWTPGSGGGFTTGTPWRPLGDNVATNNVQTMAAVPGSLWNTYRRLVHVRAASMALRRGTYQQLATVSSSVYGFLRYHEQESVVVVHNFAAAASPPPQLALAASRLAPGVYTAENLLTGAALTGVTVEADGGFGPWSPAGLVGGRGSLVVRLVPADRQHAGPAAAKAGKRHSIAP
jgi:glycosidase